MNMDEFNKKYKHSDIKQSKLMLYETEQLLLCREQLYNIAYNREPNGSKLSDKYFPLPVNIKRLLNKVIHDKNFNSNVVSIDNIIEKVNLLIENHKKNDITNILYIINIRINLASKLLYNLKITEDQLIYLLDVLESKYNLSKITIGEMVGVVAAQSLSAPMMQLTLNSVDYDTTLVLDWTSSEEGPPVRPNEKIGLFIDNLIEKYKDDCVLQPDKHTIYLPLKSGTAKALSVDENGLMMWTDLEAVN